MPAILIVEKMGSIKPSSIKSFVEEELFKKAGFKTAQGFKCFTTWNMQVNNKKYAISLFGKTDGRANQENKYEFPPPVDKILFFGNCILINKDPDTNTCIDLIESEWEQIYEKLYGGFEDLGDEEDDDEDTEDTEDDEANLTKSGYVKDDFIVEDEEEYDEEDDDVDDDDVDDDDDEISTKKKKVILIKKKIVKKPQKKAFEPLIDPEPIVENYLDCTSELCEEEYV